MGCLLFGLTTATVEAGKEKGATKCNDFLDNDGDGATDCADSDCASQSFCPSSEVCDDTIDNDLDGFTDCADIDDCGADSFCSGGGTFTATAKITQIFTPDGRIREDLYTLTGCTGRVVCSGVAGGLLNTELWDVSFQDTSPQIASTTTIHFFRTKPNLEQNGFLYGLPGHRPVREEKDGQHGGGDLLQRGPRLGRAPKVR